MPNKILIIIFLFSTVFMYSQDRIYEYSTRNMNIPDIIDSGFLGVDIDMGISNEDDPNEDFILYRTNYMMKGRFSKFLDYLEFGGLAYYSNSYNVNIDPNIETIKKADFIIKPSLKLSLYSKYDFNYDTDYDYSRFVPNVSVLVGYAYKNSDVKMEEYKDLSVSLLLRNQLSDILSMTTNIRITNKEDGSKRYSYGQNYQLEIVRSTSVFFEYFGDFKRADFFFDTNLGLVYMMGRDINIKVSGGNSFGKVTPKYFFNFGVSFRISTDHRRRYKDKNPVVRKRGRKSLFN
ncbi:MAG: hypothetical protein HRT66_10950 [Flavobacteriaceae bacterium]|nr:hypothetical protein [Flavobacteriaceae bacterium]